ncbi:hypothetical protein [Streptomyces sp. NPDC056480]|uniref:hypothetical protein n=1 Tax=Streptomyces sp. NPDC056480 TaxID=3345833 RepID=UPI003686E9DF
MDLLGRRMLERDEPGAELVRAMRAERGSERVTMAQIGQALEEGIAAVAESPSALVRSFALVDPVPDWVDFDLAERGPR